MKMSDENGAESSAQGGMTLGELILLSICILMMAIGGAIWLNNSKEAAAEKARFAPVAAQREALEAQISKCAIQGDCLKITGRGIDEKRTIDLTLLNAAAVRCLDATCDFKATNGTDEMPRLAAMPDGQLLAWVDQNGHKVGKSSTPVWSNGKIVWTDADFTKD